MGSDFNVLYDSGLALWRGQYTGLYPLPTNGLFALLALLPRQVALALISFVGLALLVATFRRQALVWIFFQPMLSALWTGQLDLIWLWFFRWGSPVSLALMTLKPQLFPLAIPELLADRAKWRPFALACTVLYGPITLIRPSWPAEWIAHANDGRLDWTISTTIMAWPIVGFAVLLAMAVIGRLDWRAIFWSVNPTIRWYDFTLMIGGSRWLILPSWLLWGASNMMNHSTPMAVLGIVDALLRGYEHRRK